MSETSELVVYETFIAGDGHPGLRTRDATVPEAVAWLREQGAIDYEAGLEWLTAEYGDRFKVGGVWKIDPRPLIQGIVDAALPREV